MEKIRPRMRMRTQRVASISGNESQYIARFQGASAYDIQDALEVMGLDYCNVEVLIDSNKIEIQPSDGDSNTYALSRNGSGTGFRVTLNRYYVEKYQIATGCYACKVDDDGTITINLKARCKDAETRRLGKSRSNSKK